MVVAGKSPSGAGGRSLSLPQTSSSHHPIPRFLTESIAAAGSDRSPALGAVASNGATAVPILTAEFNTLR